MNSFLLWVILPVSVLWLISEIGISLFTYSPKQAKEHDRYSFPIMVTTTMTAVPLGIYCAAAGIGKVVSLPSYLAIVGLVLMLSGIAFRWVAILTLKKHFSIHVGIGEDHRLIQHGPYRFLRHPSYTGSLVCFLGMGLAYLNPFSLFLMFVPPLFALLNRIHVEEKVLIGVFGDQYRDYQTRTHRLIPGLY